MMITERLRKITSLALLSWVFILPATVSAGDQLNVVTTTVDLASIAREVGGDKVKVTSLATGNMDIHFIPAQPNYISLVNKADVFIEVGLDLEIGWTPRVLAQARNTKVMVGQIGYCVSFQGIDILLPQQQDIDRSMGDLHAQGNPHYWPDPINGIIVAKNIRDTFTRVDPTNKLAYETNFQIFSKKVKKILVKNIKLLRQFKGAKLISYHQEFDYLVNRYSMSIADNIEERPGVLPSPARINKMIKYIKKNNIPVVLVSPWSNIAISRKIANESGAELLILPIQTDSAPGTETYLKMIEETAKMLHNALQKAK